MSLSLHILPGDQLYPALLRGDLDLLVQPLHLVDTIPPEGIANAALISRQEPVSCLLIHPEARAQKVFQLPHAARVASPFPWQIAQMQDFRPDIRWVTWNENLEHYVQALHTRQLDALLTTLPESKLVETAFPDVFSLTINPRECCPAPGLGSVLLQCSTNDKYLRKQLQTLHRKDIAETTNVERQLLRLMEAGNRLGAFCERDDMGNVHLWVAWSPGEDRPLQRQRLSSSTTFELAEQAFSLIH